MNPKEIVKGEFIGLTIEVTDAKNPSLKGIKGKVIDETKYTFTITDGQKTKKILKEQITITTKINNKTITIEGKSLVARPEERIKKKVKL